MDCIFCKIVNNELNSYTLYEDDIVKVFLDVNPESNGHTLIIPKKHIRDLDDMDIDTISHIMKIAKEIKHLITSKLKCDGLTLIQNNGDVQEVKHFHLHLKPYYKNKQEILSLDDVYQKIQE